MAASKPHAPTNTRSFPDPDLDNSIKDNARPVVDCASKNISKSFHPRIKSQVTKDPGQSYPVDLNQVSARLFQIAARGKKPDDESDHSPWSSDSSFSPVSSSGTSTPPTVETKRQENLLHERKCYGKLVNDGARPWYSIDLIEDVSRNPRHYRQLLRYWQGEFPNSNQDSWLVFGDQWRRWKEFRKWQGQMRLGYKEAFRKYIEQTKERLSELSYDGPVELERNPKDQSQLSTWVEYLNFELSQFQDVSWYKSRQDEYEKSWDKLVATGVLRDGDTREYIESAECASYRDKEKIRVRQAVEIARSAILLAERDTLDPSQRGSAVHKKLSKAQHELDDVIQKYDTFKKWKDAVQDFSRATAEYREARCKALRHEILLNWASAEIPKIQKELESVEVKDNVDEAASKTDGGNDKQQEGEVSPHTPNSCCSKRNRSDDGAEEQNPKRMRGSSGVEPLTDEMLCDNGNEPASTGSTNGSAS